MNLKDDQLYLTLKSIFVPGIRKFGSIVLVSLLSEKWTTSLHFVNERTYAFTRSLFDSIILLSSDPGQRLFLLCALRSQFARWTIVVGLRQISTFCWVASCMDTWAHVERVTSERLAQASIFEILFIYIFAVNYHNTIIGICLFENVWNLFCIKPFIEITHLVTEFLDIIDHNECIGSTFWENS